MENTREFRGPKGKVITFDYAQRELRCKQIVVERIWPRRLREFRVPLAEIGRNSVSHPPAQAGGVESLIVQTMRGRIWIPSDLPDVQQVLGSLQSIWEENQRVLSDRDRLALERRSSASHPVAKVVAAVLFLILVVIVIYYFTVILPNLEV